MFKRLVFSALITICAFAFSSPILAAYPPSYLYYLEQGKKALEGGNYQEARDAFNRAHLIVPDEPEPQKYLNELPVASDSPSVDNSPSPFHQSFDYYMEMAKEA